MRPRSLHRTSLQLAELEREGGFGPHVSPMTDSQSLTSLLNRAGFTLSTVDVDEITVAYPSIFELIDDLRWMGESNSVLNAQKGSSATQGGTQQIQDKTLVAAAAIYKELHGLKDGTIPATFQIMHMVCSKMLLFELYNLYCASCDRNFCMISRSDGRRDQINLSQQQEALVK
jgi:hypothetical protein